MVTGPFIPQGAVYHDEVRGLSRRNNLTCRGEANEQLAPAGEQLLGYKNGEGCTNDPANNPYLLPAEVECVEFGVIAGPARERLCRPSLSQPAHQIAIGVKNADGGHRQSIKPLLSPCFTQQPAGVNTDGMDVCLLSRIGGTTMFYLPCSDGGKL
jgi:hypothetical protein